MKHLKRFSIISENHQYQNEIDLIVSVMRDFLDDDRKVLFKSLDNHMKYKDYIDKNQNYMNFNPVVKAGNILRSQFSIVFQDIKDYQHFVTTTNEMVAAIGRLKDEDWDMYDFKVGTSAPAKNQGEVNFTFISYHFSKPDQKLDEEFVYPTKKQIDDILRKWGLIVDDLEWNEIRGKENEAIVEFSSLGYSGEMPKNIEDCFDLVCDKFGFSSYSYEFGQSRVYFYYEP